MGGGNGFEPGFEPIFFAVWRTFCVRGWRGAPHRRGAAPLENFRPHKALGKHICPRRSGPKCSTGKTFFVGNLAKRVNPVSYHAYHEVLRTVSLSLSEGLPPESTSPSARRGRRHPVPETSATVSGKRHSEVWRGPVKLKRHSEVRVHTLRRRNPPIYIHLPILGCAPT